VVEEGVLKPSFDFVRGLHFPKLDGRTMEDLRDVVGSLISKGLISESRADKLVACPHCGSRLILTYYTCPYCHSRNVSKENLYEHLVCGAISRESSVRVDNKLVCPVCKRELKELSRDYSVVGAWFECEDCRRSFEAPIIIHRCLKCDHEFDVRSSRYEHVASYAPTPLGVEVARKLRVLKVLSQVGVTSGFEVEWFGTVKGASGIVHEFSILARRQGVTVAVDVASNGGRGLITLTATLAKVYDTPTVKPIVAIMPKAPAEAAALAGRYNIVILEGESAEALGEKFEAYLKGLVEELSKG